MQNPSQPAAPPPDPFMLALADLESVLAELHAPEDEGMNALAAMQPPQQAPQGANALAPMAPAAGGYPSQAWGR
jgi:hypothetical protein